MPLSDADICNQALARIGQRKPITAIDGSDTSANAALCALLYPKARNKLLSRFPWFFATRGAILVADPNVFAGSLGNLPGYAHAYTDPADLVKPLYIFNGARPGAGVVQLFASSPGFFSGLFSPQPAINGEVLRIPFAHAGGHIFTDWTDEPAAWDATVFYGLNAVVIASTGNYYRSTLASNHANNPVSAGGWAGTGTDHSFATLVYTARLTDPTVFPDHFVEALAARLAPDLALSLATKPALARGLKEESEEAFMEAVAADANGQEPDARPDPSFLSVRG